MQKYDQKVGMNCTAIIVVPTVVSSNERTPANTTGLHGMRQSSVVSGTCRFAVPFLRPDTIGVTCHGDSSSPSLGVVKPGDRPPGCFGTMMASGVSAFWKTSTLAEAWFGAFSTLVTEIFWVTAFPRAKDVS